MAVAGVPGAGAHCFPVHGHGAGAGLAFILVLFILLVIIIRAVWV